MRSTAFRWLWLLFLVVWFVGVMPGHERGIVAFDQIAPEPVNPAAAKDCGGCCPLPEDEPADEDAPVEDPAKTCLICFLRATLDLPVDVAFDPPGLLFEFEIAAPPRVIALHAIAAPDELRGRGPPAA